MASGGLNNTAVEWKPGVAQQFQTKVFRLHPSECTQILVQYREPDVSDGVDAPRRHQMCQGSGC